MSAEIKRFGGTSIKVFSGYQWDPLVSFCEALSVSSSVKTKCRYRCVFHAHVLTVILFCYTLSYSGDTLARNLFPVYATMLEDSLYIKELTNLFWRHFPSVQLLSLS